MTTFRLATSGLARCPILRPDPGVVFEHLLQFELQDRAGMAAALALDRGPGVIAVVPGSPAAIAGIQPADVLLLVDGVAVPAEAGLTAPFDALRSHRRMDEVDALFARKGVTPVTLLRDGRTVTVTLVSRLACPSRVRLARSAQRNAFADGENVFVTTGLIAQLGSDDELAFVLAHEMAHNILHHGELIRGGEVRRGLARTLGRSGEIVRETERAADALGGTLMLDAGYDPVAGAQALKRLTGMDLRLGLFDSHQSVAARIAAMRALKAAWVPR